MKNVVNNIFSEIFQKEYNMKIEDVLKKLAFDVKLPNKVIDSVTGKVTWATSLNSSKYISQKNMMKYDKYKGWMRDKKQINSIDDIIKMWDKINYTTTERNYDSSNVFESDTIYNSQNVFRSQNCIKCKNIIFSDSCVDSEYILACQRSTNLNYCIRVDDSKNCSNSYNVICSAKISNSFFIQDSNSLYECMFCSHIENKRYCIANMQFNKEEYMLIKKSVINWILKELKKV